MMETSNFISFLDQCQESPRKRRSSLPAVLPEKLSYLQDYIKYQPDWVNEKGVKKSPTKDIKSPSLNSENLNGEISAKNSGDLANGGRHAMIAEQKKADNNEFKTMENAKPDIKTNGDPNNAENLKSASGIKGSSNITDSVILKPADTVQSKMKPVNQKDTSNVPQTSHGHTIYRSSRIDKEIHVRNSRIDDRQSGIENIRSSQVKNEPSEVNSSSDSQNICAKEKPEEKSRTKVRHPLEDFI